MNLIILAHAYIAPNAGIRATCWMATQHHQQTSNSNQCPVCNMILASRQSLRRHWNNWHQDRNKGILEEYLRQLDLAGRNHICPICGKAFSRSNIHQEKVHQQQGLKHEPRFQCTFTGCPTSPFYFLKDLLQHCKISHQDQLGIKFDFNTLHCYPMHISTCMYSTHA